MSARSLLGRAVSVALLAIAAWGSVGVARAAEPVATEFPQPGGATGPITAVFGTEVLFT